MIDLCIAAYSAAEIVEAFQPCFITRNMFLSETVESLKSNLIEDFNAITEALIVPNTTVPVTNAETNGPIGESNMAWTPSRILPIPLNQGVKVGPKDSAKEVVKFSQVDCTVSIAPANEAILCSRTEAAAPWELLFNSSRRLV